MSDSLRFGLVGCGRIAQTAHLPALEKARGASLVALCDVRVLVARRLADRYAIERIYDDLDAFLADRDIEAVLIAVPDRLHVEVATRALRAGKHVLLEKPIGVTVAEAAPLVDLAARGGLRFQVGAMKRHDPGIEFARSFVAEDLGRIVSFDMWYCVSRYRPGFEASLFSPLVFDGTPDERDIHHKADRSRYLLLTHGAHIFDTLRFVLGDVDELNARLETPDGVFSWHGLVHLASGGLGHFELTVPVNGDWAEGFEIRGERGTVSIRTFFPFFLRPSEVRAFNVAGQEWRIPLCDVSDPFVRQIEAFAKAVREDGPTSPDASDGLAALRLIETVERSVASRGWEQVVG